MSAVGIDIASTRRAALRLEQQIRLVDGLRHGHGTVIALTADDDVLTPVRTALAEFTEDTGNVVGMLRRLADYAEAADTGSTGGELSHFEAHAITALQRMRRGLDDGIGSAASDHQIEAYLDAVTDAYLASDEYRRYQLQYGEFDLGDSFEGGVMFSDGSTWRNGLIDCDHPPEVEFNGGGAIRGPDDRVYPIIIPTWTDEHGVRHTHRIGDLDGYDSGWEPIAYRVGYEQFSNEMSTFGKLVVTAAEATGLHVGPMIPDDHLAGLQFRFDEPPRLGSAPVDADTSGYQSSGSGRVGSTIDYAVAGLTAFRTFNSLNSNVDRAYEVMFEEHESGARRATVTTHTIGVANGRPHLAAWNVYITEDDQLAQFPASYMPRDHPVFDVPAIESGPLSPIKNSLKNRNEPVLVGGSPIEIEVRLALDD